MHTVIKIIAVTVFFIAVYFALRAMDRYDARKAREWAEGDET